MGAVAGMVRRHGGLVAVVVAAALWGVGGTAAGYLFARGAEPLDVISVRCWTSFAGLGLVLLWRRPVARDVRRAWRSIVAFGLTVGVANAALYLTIARLPVAVALVLQNLAPAFVFAWSAVMTRRLPALRTVLGLVIAFVGVAFVVELPTTPIGSISLSGVFFGLLTAAGAAAFSAFGGRAARACGALPATTCAFAISSVGWLFYQVPRGTPALFARPGLLLGAVGVGVFGTLVPFLLFSWGTARTGAALGAINISLEPLFGAALAWLWLGQSLSPGQLAGAAVLLLALVDVQRASFTRRSASRTAPSHRERLLRPSAPLRRPEQCECGPT